MRKTPLRYEYELSCPPCGYNVIKQKRELSKSSEKKNFNNRLKNAEDKIFCSFIEICKLYEGNDFDKIFEALSKLKN